MRHPLAPVLADSLPPLLHVVLSGEGLFSDVTHPGAFTAFFCFWKPSLYGQAKKAPVARF